jgi:hypothetical protein
MVWPASYLPTACRSTTPEELDARLCRQLDTGSRHKFDDTRIGRGSLSGNIYDLSVQVPTAVVSGVSKSESRQNRNE